MTTATLRDPRRITESDPTYQRLHAETVAHLRHSIALYAQELQHATTVPSPNSFITRHTAILTQGYVSGHAAGARPFPDHPGALPDASRMHRTLSFYVPSVAKMAAEGILAWQQAQQSRKFADPQPVPLDDEDLYPPFILDWAQGEALGARLILQGQIIWPAMQNGYLEAGAKLYTKLYWDLDPLAKMHCNDCPGIAAASPYDPPGSGGNELTQTPGDGHTECGAGCRCALRYADEVTALSENNPDTWMFYNPWHDERGRFTTSAGGGRHVARGEGRTIRQGGKRVSNSGYKASPAEIEQHVQARVHAARQRAQRLEEKAAKAQARAEQLTQRIRKILGTGYIDDHPEVQPLHEERIALAKQASKWETEARRLHNLADHPEALRYELTHPPRATIHVDERTRQTVDEIFNRPMTSGELERMVGAQRGDTVTISERGMEHIDIEMSSHIPGRDMKMDIANEGGEIIAHVQYANSGARTETQVLPDGSTRQILLDRSAESGRMIIDAMEAMHQAGIDRIETDATGGGQEGLSSKSANGYRTWPRLGFKGDIPVGLRGAIRAKFGEDITRVEDMMKTSARRKWWNEHGEQFYATFDFHDSESLAVLARLYHAAHHGEEDTSLQERNDALIALMESDATYLFYSPNQPRNRYGRWTPTGAGRHGMGVGHHQDGMSGGGHVGGGEGIVRATIHDPTQSHAYRHALQDERFDIWPQKGRADPYLHELLHEQGFDGLPHIVGHGELDRYVAAGEREIWHGYGQASHIDQFLHGDFFVAEGTAGSGHYTAPERWFAQHYNHAGMLRMTLKAGARVIKLQDLETARNAYIKSHPPEPNDEKFLGFIHNNGRFAAGLGYDAIEEPHLGEIIILNRTAVRVEGEPYAP